MCSRWRHMSRWWLQDCQMHFHGKRALSPRVDFIQTCTQYSPCRVDIGCAPGGAPCHISDCSVVSSFQVILCNKCYFSRTIWFTVFSGVLPAAEYSQQRVIWTYNCCFDNRYLAPVYTPLFPAAHAADLWYTTVVTSILRPWARPMI